MSSGQEPTATWPSAWQYDAPPIPSTSGPGLTASLSTPEMPSEKKKKNENERMRWNGVKERAKEGDRYSQVCVEIKAAQRAISAKSGSIERRAEIMKEIEGLKKEKEELKNEKKRKKETDSVESSESNKPKRQCASLFFAFNLLFTLLLFLDDLPLLDRSLSPPYACRKEAQQQKTIRTLDTQVPTSALA